MNLRVVVRSLRRTPGLTATAILTLALGVGLSTAVFTIADALLLRRLPVPDENRVVVLWGETRDGRFRNFPLLLSSDAPEFARRAGSLERAAFFTYEGAWPQLVRDGEQLTRLRQALVSGGFFDVIGAVPVLGRTLRPEDDRVGASPVAVLSHGAWQRQFRGDAAVVGRRLTLHGTGVTYTIVGVMPQGLDYPKSVELWAPVVPARTPPGSFAPFAEVDIIGRLRPGASPIDARNELTAFFQRTEAPATSREVRGVVHTLPDIILGDTKPAVLIAAAAAGLLLLITCINIANLLLVRGFSRIGEIAVRAALGARRRVIIAQLLGESGVLAIAGGVVGAALAVGAVRVFVMFAPPGTPRLDEIHVNGTALGAAVAITGVAMLLFAVAPAVMMSQVDLQAVLRSSAWQGGVSSRFRRAAEAMVVGQVALALLVLSASGLILKSFLELRAVDLAFDPSRVLIADLAFQYNRAGDVQQQLRLLDALVSRLQATPGVRGVSPAVAVPFSGVAWDAMPAAEGQTPEQSAANPMLNMELVAPAYFAALDMPVVRGRAFTDADRAGGQRVVVISESAARHYWPNEDPIGKRFVGSAGEPALTVVGIVPDARYRNLRDARPSIYFPVAQSSFPFAPTTLVIRTVGEPEDAMPMVRRTIDEGDPRLSLASAAPFASFVMRELAQPRLHALLLAIFAGAGVALAAVGLFGLMTAMVRQRTRELGIRMAVGATSGDLVRMVMGRGLALAGAGTAIGLIAALATNRLLATLLFQVDPADGVTLGVVATLMLGVATLASAIPARASTRIDPSVTLRAET